jgi:3-oxoacyl-[acyl-carrier-protein] synthase II
MPGADRLRSGSPDIVVTGVGAVTAFGWGAAPLWEGLRRGVAAIGPVARFDATHHRTHLSAEVPLENAQPSPVRRASLADRFAIAAAREAIASAGLDVHEVRRRTGVFFGSSTGGMLESELFYETFLSSRGRHARPSLLASQQFNGPGDAVARDAGICGPVETVSSACSSGAMALGAALRAMRRGEADVVLAGGSDALCQLTYAGFNSLRAVDEAPTRPFRKSRAGLTLGEGAGVLVLERGDHARRRGATILAELAGASETCDAQHMTAPHPEGEGARDAITRALADAGAVPAEVDFINAHGTGTPLNDAAEAAALQRVFGDRAGSIPLTSTKAAIGHLLGSAGAVEALVTVLCLLRSEVHPMPEAGEADDAFELDLVLGRPRPLGRAACAVSTSLAFGGANAALVFRREKGA